jgi:hypothetical protein
VIHAEGRFVAILDDVAMELDTTIHGEVDFSLGVVVER